MCCPPESRIGGGTAHGHADGFPSGRYDFILDIDLFLAPPQKKGDLAGVVVQAKDRTSPVRAHGTGRVVPLAHGRYGVQLRFENLDELGGAAYPGVTVAIDKAHLSAAASRLVPTERTVKQGGKTKHVTVNVRHSLLTNPKRCAGSWPFRLRLHFSDGRPDQLASRNVACSG